MGTLSKAAGALLVIFFTSSAYSADWYIGAGGGVSDIILTAYDDGTGSQAYFGRQLDEALAVEVILMDFGDFDHETDGNNQISGSSGAIALVPRRMVTSWLDVYAKVGITSWEMDATYTCLEITTTCLPYLLGTTVNESESGTDLLWGGGIEWLPINWLGVSGEFIRYTKVDGDDLDTISATVRFRF